MTKQIRKFYDFDDKEVWSSYDGENISVLLRNDIIINSEKLANQELEGKLDLLGTRVENYNNRKSKLLTELLKEENLHVTVQKVNFPYKSEPKLEDLTFNTEDTVSKDNNQYKIFHMYDYGVLAAKNITGDIEVIHWDHGQTVSSLLEHLAELKLGLRSFARYSPDDQSARFHKPEVQDFILDFDVIK